MLDVFGEPRQQRGLEIAATAKIERKGGAWLVPSQSGKGRYTVIPHAETPHCTCPDHEDGGHKCKHLFAVEYVLRRERNADGTTTVTETMTVQKTVQRVYPQNWRAYNAAQTHEKAKFQELLRDLCSGVAELPQSKRGRPRLRVQDALFSAVFKVYSTVSGRRFMTDLREAQAKGCIQKTPHFNSIFNYLENPELTPILRALITESSLPLKAVEVDFACDSSGFTTSRFHRWFDHKYGAVRQQHEWVKVHLMCGVRTNIVTAVEIKDKDASDTKLLPALVDATAENFRLNEVSADKGYGSLKNYKAIQYHGATPYIAFKSIHTGRAPGLWQRMFHYYNFNRDQFLAHYHKRSNVESTFSMIKAKFRDHVRSKTDVAMVNEVLCKILCHNICCLIQESYELGIATVFWEAA
ncbi:MAG TPA: transposase [Xanthobacteraceae bacterium]|nr:transposase [Xanthobacteraceae bacterium]